MSMTGVVQRFELADLDPRVMSSELLPLKRPMRCKPPAIWK